MTVLDKAIVAVSGGIDSTVCLYEAIKNCGVNNTIAVSCSYGQKHSIELRIADALCERLGIAHITVDLTNIFSYNLNVSSLMSGSNRCVNEGRYRYDGSVMDTYIPNRNGLIINILCTIGLQVFNNEPFNVVIGTHNGDAPAYPDCSNEFINTTAEAISMATAGKCKLYAPLQGMDKTQVVKKGVELGMTKADFNKTYSCYAGGIIQCGKCATCIDRITALVNSGVYTRVSDITANYELSNVGAMEYFNEQ